MRLKIHLYLALVLSLALGLALAACGDNPTPTTVPVSSKAASTTVAATTANQTTASAATTAAAKTTVAASTAAAATTTAAKTSAAATTTAAKTTAAATTTNTPAKSNQTYLLPKDPISKADPDLVAIITKYNSAKGSADQKLKAASDYADSIGVIDESHEVYFEVILTKNANQQPVTERLKAVGATVDDVSDEGDGVKIILATVPLKQMVTYNNPTTKENFLRHLGALKEVTQINLPTDQETLGLANLPKSIDALITLAEATKNQGVKIMGADKWQAAGINGKGVTIGIIDSGYMFIDQLKGQGYLPADFAVTDFAQKLLSESSIDNGVHGSAVSEIIYSVAPGAKLVATSIKGTSAEFSEAIDFLVSQKVDLISISMGNNSSSEDGNSPLSKKVEQVRKEKGILFFLAAGNEGTEHYGGKFNPDANGFHQWQPGLTRLLIGNPSTNPIPSTVILRWDQFLDGGVNPDATDLDLIVEDAQGNALGISDGDQRSRPPVEVLPLNLPPNTPLYLRVRQKPGTAAPSKPFTLHIFLTGGLSPQLFTPTQTVGSQADSRGAIAVGAVDPPEGNTIGSYSSQGPLSDGRIKPEISGPAGVDSASYQAKGSGTGKFNGTSAATPEVSGLAAILKSSNPSLSADEWTQVIFESAVKPEGVTTSGIDPVFGYGKASLVNITPGPVKPKGSLQSPPTNPNPEFKYSSPSYLPSPVPDTPPAGGATQAPAAAPVTVTPLEVDPSIVALTNQTLKAGTVINISYAASNAGADTVIAAADRSLLAQGYKFSIPGNTKPVTTGPTTLALYSKEGEPDVYIQLISLPDEPAAFLASSLPNIAPDAVQKLLDQLKGQKTIRIVVLGTDLAKNFGG